jgi:Uma2 family endonuclease
MATSALISLEDYLNTSYRPDREYMDGEVVERNTGKWQHARIQALLTMWFGQHESMWHVQTATEWRTRVAETRVRIPDVVLVRTGAQPDVLEEAPVLIVEILSAGDTYADTQSRAQDYLRMGVQTIWIVDPETRTGRVCQVDSWTQAERLEVPGTPIFVELTSLFAALDGSQRI